MFEILGTTDLIKNSHFKNMYKNIFGKSKRYVTAGGSILSNKDLSPLDYYIKNQQQYSQLSERIIEGIYDNGPAGLLHIKILSKIIKLPIRIWQNYRLIYIIGNVDEKIKIDIDYKKYNKFIGHWSLRGGSNPQSSGSNNCLYDVVASQTGFKSSQLRREIANFVRKNRKIVTKLFAEDNDDFLLGGATYLGRSPSDAQYVLDASQNGHCHPEGYQGHPRGHASGPSTGRSEDSVETYSYSRWRSGFLSRGDQDLVCHFSLITGQARDLMESLNSGRQKVVSHIRRNELDYDPLPQAQIWRNGSREGSPGNFSTVCLVGKHFLGQHNNPRADIFIVTFYPIL